MNDPITEMREKMVVIGRALYERFLTDAAGGNLSARIGDKLVMSPRYAGSKWSWRLRPEQYLILDLDGHKLDGDGEVSREYRVHKTLLNEFYPECTAVVHGHARNVLVFCAAQKPIPPVLYQTDKFGVIQHVADAPAHSQDLADNIAAAIRPQTERVRKGAVAVMAPRHGLFVLGKDIESAYDSADRIENNAYCVLMSKLLEE
ncbi:MAG: class II aldolase/adducin family protein [Anaerolineales bacterium]